MTTSWFVGVRVFLFVLLVTHCVSSCVIVFVVFKMPLPLSPSLRDSLTWGISLTARVLVCATSEVILLLIFLSSR